MTESIARTLAAAPAPAGVVAALAAEVDKLIDSGSFDVAYSFLKNLSTLVGPDVEVSRRFARLYRVWVPRWHFLMLNDNVRNQALAHAIAQLDLRGKVVLDLGAGTGLLSMMAAKHGAAHVYACEMIAPVADKAIEIIADNGYADLVTVIPKVSYDIRVGVDMPCRADVLLSETIDCGFVGEGFLGALRHARTDLLRPNAALLPRAFALHGALLESEAVYRLNTVENVEGFRLGGFNELSTRGYFPVRLDTWPHRLLSDRRILVAQDLTAYSFTPIDGMLELQANATGQVHGIVFWFHVVLVPGVSLSNEPGGKASHWMQAFACFPQPVAVDEGDTVVVRFAISDRAADITYVHTRAATRPRSVTQARTQPANADTPTFLPTP